MTKAEKIFRDTYTECRVYLDRWGYRVNPNGEAVGFNGLITEDAVCTRTLNAVQKRLDSERKAEAVAKKYGFSPERRERNEKALNMVQSTLNNARKAL